SGRIRLRRSVLPRAVHRRRRGCGTGRRGHPLAQGRAELARDYPGIPAFDSQAALIAAGVDAVTITTLPETRRELVLEAVAAGVHVIADKPFAPTADDGRALVAAAAHASVVLNVF